MVLMAVAPADFTRSGQRQLRGLYLQAFVALADRRLSNDGEGTMSRCFSVFAGHNTFLDGYATPMARRCFGEATLP